MICAVHIITVLLHSYTSSLLSKLLSTVQVTAKLLSESTVLDNWLIKSTWKVMRLQLNCTQLHVICNRISPMQYTHLRHNHSPSSFPMLQLSLCQLPLGNLPNTRRPTWRCRQSLQFKVNNSSSAVPTHYTLIVYSLQLLATFVAFSVRSFHHLKGIHYSFVPS